MSATCIDLTAFADGELAPAAAAAFRAHLTTCDHCRDRLVVEVALGFRLETLPPTPAHVHVLPRSVPANDALPSSAFPSFTPDLLDPAITARAASSTPRAPSAPTAPTAPHAPSASMTGPRMLRSRAAWTATFERSRATNPSPDRSHLTVAAASVLAAAAVAVAIFGSPVPSFVARREPAPPAATSPFPALTSRPYDTRIALADAARYLPRNQRQATAAGPRERVPNQTLAALERSGNKHALGVAMAYNDEDLRGAVEQLRNAEQTDAARSDLVALEIPTARTDQAERLLAELETLRDSRDPAVAGAARWNYAILLARLDLPAAAAQQFRAIAAGDAPGWAAEARERAAVADNAATDLRTTWERADEQGKALAATGAPIPAETLRRFPGLMRAYFYAAVRAAPSRDRVLALEPIATTLDRLDGQPTLRDYLQRVARLDFVRRAPLAAAYARLLRNEPLSADLLAKLTTVTPSPDVVDIVMGALADRDLAADHLDAFQHMVAQARDPWFDILLAVQTSTVDLQRSDWLGAEARLRNARTRCSPATSYPCLVLSRQLAKLLRDLHRFPEAIAVLHDALHTALGTSEWGHYLELLSHLADVERFHAATATARAYADEVRLLAGPRCKYIASAHATLAGAALLDVDGRTARRHLDAQLALDCAKPDLRAAHDLTDIGRLDPQPDDLPRLQTWLTQLRTRSALTAAQRILADEIEGRLLIEHDRAAGTALLHAAITAARALPRDILATQARAGAYSVLALDAARNRDPQRALTLLADDLNLPVPPTCAVAIVAEDERAAIIVRGPDGIDHTHYDPAHPPRAGALTLPAALTQPLTPCPHVQVLANPATQAQPRLLPSTLAWSYATGTAAARSSSPATDSPSSPVSPSSPSSPASPSSPPSPSSPSSASSPSSPSSPAPPASSRTPAIAPAAPPPVAPPSSTGAAATPAVIGDAALSQAPSAFTSVVVTNITPPDDLALLTLAPRAPDPTPSTLILSGPQATPARVLAAIRDATSVHFHTHALVDLGIPDASHLVLSPGTDGRYALTAEAIRTTDLRGQPIIVLDACRSAQPARYQHAPWSLPHAFLAAGARAVFAAATDIPDADSWPFFARVLARIRAGTDPAAALRDERIATLASHPSMTWVADVLLFE